MQRKRLEDKLVEECTESADEVNLDRIILAQHKDVRKSSCTLYIVSFSTIFTINIGIGTYFVHFKYMNCDKKSVCRYDYVYQEASY